MISMDGLQIGNWLEHRFSPLVAKVTDLSSSGLIRIEGIYDWLHMSAYSPIPLTSEILIACGFVRYMAGAINGNWRLPHYDSIPFEIYFDGYDWSMSWDDQSYSCDVHVRSLHQLQNLYFSLTGEELIYKP